tara:strand:- start:1540 stop:2508 length:969 start_codon:yes stop_codon:yes gene_type:complete
MKNYDITYISSNISFLLDCYINSFKNLNLLLIDREDKLGGAWQISDARVHLQWVNKEHKKYIETINNDLKKVDGKFEIKGPLKNVKTIDDKKYISYSLYHINLGSNLFMKELIEKIKSRNNIKIVKDDIKEIILENDIFNIIGKKTYSSKKLYLTNNLKLDKITLNKKEYKLYSQHKKYKHFFIKVKSKDIKPLDVLICEGNDFYWNGEEIFDRIKQDIHKKLNNSLFFMINVSELYNTSKNIQLFSCRVKNKSFIEDFKSYLIYNKITENDVEIKVLEDDEYIQHRLMNTYIIPKTKNLEVFTEMNYFKYLVKLNKLRNEY